MKQPPRSLRSHRVGFAQPTRVAGATQCVAFILYVGGSPCMASPPRHDGIAAATLYNEASRNLVLALKHGRRIALAPMLARLMAAIDEQLALSGVKRGPQAGH